MRPKQAEALIRAVKGPEDSYFPIKRERQAEAAAGLGRVIDLRQALEGESEDVRVQAMTDALNSGPDAATITAVLRAAGEIEDPAHDRQIVLAAAGRLTDGLDEDYQDGGKANALRVMSALELVEAASGILGPDGVFKALELTKARMESRYFEEHGVHQQLTVAAESIRLGVIETVESPDQSVVDSAYAIATLHIPSLEAETRDRAARYVVDNIDSLGLEPVATAGKLFDILDRTNDPAILTDGIVLADAKIKLHEQEQAALRLEFDTDKEHDLSAAETGLERTLRSLEELDQPLVRRGRKAARKRLRSKVRFLSTQKAAIETRQFAQAPDYSRRLEDIVSGKAVFLLQTEGGEQYLDSFVSETENRQGPQGLGVLGSRLSASFADHYDKFVKNQADEGVNAESMAKTRDWIKARFDITPLLGSGVVSPEVETARPRKQAPARDFDWGD